MTLFNIGDQVKIVRLIDNGSGDPIPSDYQKKWLNVDGVIQHIFDNGPYPIGVESLSLDGKTSVGYFESEELEHFYPLSSIEEPLDEDLI